MSLCSPVCVGEVLTNHPLHISLLSFGQGRKRNTFFKKYKQVSPNSKKFCHLSGEANKKKKSSEMFKDFLNYKPLNTYYQLSKRAPKWCPKAILGLRTNWPLSNRKIRYDLLNTILSDRNAKTSVMPRKKAYL